MTGIEITLILVGIIFIFGSFFVEEKLTNKEMEEIAGLSEKQLNMIVDRQLRDADTKIEDAIDELADDTLEIAKRALEKESNEKIMAVSEYSNTVIETMNKTHNEILFLYDMLEDKHKELTELAASLQQFSDTMKTTEHEVLQNLVDAARDIEQKTDPEFRAERKEESVKEEDAEQTEEDPGNHNDRILKLCRQGMTDVEIARQLGLGLGEVRLVIGLYKGEQTGEA